MEISLDRFCDLLPSRRRSSAVTLMPLSQRFFFYKPFLRFHKNIPFVQVVRASSAESGGDAARLPLVQMLEAAGSCSVRGSIGSLHTTSKCILG